MNHSSHNLFLQAFWGREAPTWTATYSGSVDGQRVKRQNISSNAILASKAQTGCAPAKDSVNLEEDIDHETQHPYHPAFAAGLVNGL
jgi:hypothetical protein